MIDYLGNIEYFLLFLENTLIYNYNFVLHPSFLPLQIPTRYLKKWLKGRKYPVIILQLKKVNFADIGIL